MSKYPAPVAGELTLYLLGPGFGESAVVRLPAGETLVVDCCAEAGRCLTLALLDDLGVTRIDHLVLTHPDLDHVDGLDTLLRARDVMRAWVWPHIALTRDLLTRWGGRRPSHRRLAEALEHLDALGDDNRRFEVTFGFRDQVWPASGARLAVLAPLPADINRARKQLERVVEWSGAGRPKLADAMVRRLVGERGSGDHPNLVSLAVALHWRGWKLLLGGDLEVSKAPARSWRGVLRELTREGRTDLVEDIDLIKVAHHGSPGAWLDDAWDAHARNRKVRGALIAPFNSHRLPSRTILRRLRDRADLLAVTSEAPMPRVTAAGWNPRMAAPGPSVVVARLRADGTYDIEGHGSAAVCN